MAAISFTTTTYAIELDGTTYPATVDRDRVVTGSTEVLTFTENAATVPLFAATIAQTFSGMTQAATVEADYFQLNESALAQGYPVEEVIEILTSVAIAGEQMYAVESDQLNESALVTEVIYPDTYTKLHDTATVTEAMNLDWTTLLDDSKGRVTEQIVQLVTVILNESATATNSMETAVNTSLHETAYASEALEASATTEETLVGSATAEGTATPYYFAELVGTATAAEVITDVLTQNDLLVGTLTGTEALVTTLVANETLSDTATATDAQDFAGSVYAELLESTIDANGYPWAKDFTALAWVMNTETQGLTSYDNFQFTSLAQLKGAVYGTTSDGIYLLSGDDDEGRNVDSTLKTGFLDFNREQTKRVSDVYVGYTGGQLECTVETYDGPQEEYTYILEEREANAPRNNRMKVGRGLSSRYWRFKFENVQGADFQIYDTAAQVAQSKRRL